MFFLFVILFISCPYLIWRYNSISNKKLFFKSPAVISLSICLAILFSCIFTVNLVRSGNPDTVSPVIAAADTTMMHLKSPRQHWDDIIFLQRNSPDSLDKLHVYYLRHQRDVNPGQSQRSYLGAGLIMFCRYDYDSAISLFNHIANTEFPCVNYGIALSYLRQNDSTRAILYLRREMNTPEGFKEIAYRKLAQVHHDISHRDSLIHLLEHPMASEYFPPSIARLVSLEEHDFFQR